MDRELLRLGLELDAAVIADLTLQGRTTEADEHLAKTRYRERFVAWRDDPDTNPRGNSVAG